MRIVIVVAVGIIICGIVFENQFIDLTEDIICETLSEFNHERWDKGRHIGVCWQTDKVL